MFCKVFTGLVIITLILIIYFLIKRKCSKIETYVFTSPTEAYDGDGVSEDILMVGGTHGNEEAGSIGLMKLVDELASGKLTLKKGRVTIIPKANPCGLKLGLRFLPHQLLAFSRPDLNRNYPQAPGQDAKCDVSQFIADVVKGKTFVYDGHEGWGFTKLQRESMGSGVYPGKSAYEKDLANRAVEELNKSIPEENKKFISQPEWPDVNGSLRMYCDKMNVPYLLVETSGQNNLQPLPVRRDQHYTVAKFILKDKGMI